MTILRQTLAIAGKDLRRELRSREITATTIMFALVLVIIFVFAFYRNERSSHFVFPGILWISILFTATLSLTRSFIDERESGCLRALALIPGTSTSLYFGKLIGNVVFIVVFELILVPLAALAFGVPLLERPGSYLAVLIGGTLGIASIGTLVSAMLVHHRLRDVLVPLILYPILVPVLIASVKATQLVLDANSLEAAHSWTKMLLGLDVLVLIGAPALFGSVLSAIE